MSANTKEKKKFRSIRVSDAGWYCLKRLSTEERCSAYILADRIIQEYFREYMEKKKNQA